MYILLLTIFSTSFLTTQQLPMPSEQVCNAYMQKYNNGEFDYVSTVKKHDAGQWVIPIGYRAQCIEVKKWQKIS